MTRSRKILIAALAVIALPLLALLAVPLLLNGNSFRPALQSQLQQTLHRPVTLGDTQVKAFPLSLRVTDLVIGQPAGFVSDQPFVAAKEVFVSVGLLPLLRKQVAIQAVRLETPRIELVHNPAGAWNYEISAQPGEESAHGGALTLDRLSVADGQIAIDDRRAGKAREVYKQINVDLKGFGPNRRGSLAANLRLDTMAANLKLRADFSTGPEISAKGNLVFASDRAKDPLTIDYEIGRRNAEAPITIQHADAKIGSLSASATGSLNDRVTPPTLQLHVTTGTAPIADLMRLAALYGAKPPANVRIDGNLKADIQITGTTDKPVFAGELRATEAQITAKELTEPVRASSLVINFTPEAANTQPFSIQTGNTRVTAQAKITGYSSDTPGIDLTLETTGARVEELLRIASAYGARPNGLNGTGAVDLDVKLSRSGNSVRYSGSGALRDVSLTSPDLPSTLTVATAAIKFADDRVGLDGLQAGFGSMHLNGSVSVKDFARPNVVFNLHVDQVDTAELSRMTASKTAPKKRPAALSLDRIQAAGAIAIDKVLYEQASLTNFKAKLSFDNGVLRLDPVTAGIFSGQESGSVTADLRQTATPFAVKAVLTNVDSNQLLCATTSVKNVSGPLSANVDLRFISGENRNPATTLNGTAQVQMGKGRISGVQILNQIASIGRFAGNTNKSEPYTDINKISSTFSIQNGVATTHDLLVDMNGATLTGGGTMGLADQALNLRVTATLTREYTQRNGLGQVGGLLSTVLANRKGDLVVPAIVSGTFSQPKFSPDAEQMAKLKLSGLFSTDAGGIQGLLKGFTGNPPDSNPPPGKAPPPDSITDIFKRLGKQNKK